MNGFTPTEMIGVVLYTALVTAFIIIGALFIRQSFKYGEEKKIKVIIFIGLFLILIGVSRLFHPVVFAFIRIDLMYQIGQLLFAASIIMIVFYVERQIFQASRYVFTISLCVCEVLFIFSPLLSPFIIRDIFTIILSIAMAAASLFVLILYLRVAIKSTGELRRNAIYVVIGIFLLAASYVSYILENFFPREIVMILTVTLSFASLPFIMKGFELSL